MNREQKAVVGVAQVPLKRQVRPLTRNLLKRLIFLVVFCKAFEERIFFFSSFFDAEDKLPPEKDVNNHESL